MLEFNYEGNVYKAGDLVTFHCPDPSCGAEHIGEIVFLNDVAAYGVKNPDNPKGSPLMVPGQDSNGRMVLGLLDIKPKK